MLSYDDRHGIAFHENLPAGLQRFYQKSGEWFGVKDDGSFMEQAEFDALVAAFEPLDHQRALTAAEFEWMLGNFEELDEALDAVGGALKSGRKGDATMKATYANIRKGLAEPEKTLTGTLALVAAVRAMSINGLTVPTDTEVKQAWADTVTASDA